jgi:hypothetical protein
MTPEAHFSVLPRKKANWACDQTSLSTEVDIAVSSISPLQKDTMVKYICAPVVTAAVIVAGHVAASVAWDELYHSYGWYVAIDVVYLVLAGQLVFAAFCLVRNQEAVWRLVLSRCAIVAASLCLAFAVLDLYIIGFCYDTSGLGGGRCFTHNRWYDRFPQRNQLGYWERDLAPYLKPRRPDRELVVAVVGDSWTWGQGVCGKERRYTDLLEAELRGNTATPVTVLNFGRAGADSTDELLQVKDAANVQPDVVVIGYLANDIDRYAPMNLDLDLNRLLRPNEPSNWRRVSYLAPTTNLLYWRMIAPQIYAELSREYAKNVRKTYADPAVMAMHLNDVAMLIAEVRSMNARPVFAILPFPAMWQPIPGAADDPARVRKLRNAVYGALTQKMGSLGVPVIEAQTIEDEMSPREFALNPMDNHPCEAAHRRMAQVIAGEFIKQNLLQAN